MARKPSFWRGDQVKLEANMYMIFLFFFFLNFGFFPEKNSGLFEVIGNSS